MPEPQGAQALPGILDSIVAAKRGGLPALRSRRSLLERQASGAPPPRSLSAALAGGDTVSLIAECKRRSPGAGDIRPDLDAAALTRGYQSAGAAAVSVLTDDGFFGGSNRDLEVVRATTGIPVLRKDFTLDALHLLEARAHGADAVLLIVRILDDLQLGSLLEETRALGMEALVETHDAPEIRRALDAGAGIVGINNRDLATFTTDLETTVRLLGDVPNGVVVVSESGIRSRDDVARLGGAGVDAVLVGEALLRDPDPAAAAGRMSRVRRVERARG